MRIPIITVLDRSYLVWDSPYRRTPGTTLLEGDQGSGPVLSCLVDECADTYIESERFGEGDLGDLHGLLDDVTRERMFDLAKEHNQYDELSQQVYAVVAKTESTSDLVTATLASLAGLPFTADGVIDHVGRVDSDLQIEYRKKGDLWLGFRIGIELRDLRIEHISPSVQVEQWYAYPYAPPIPIGVLSDEEVKARANPFR